MGLLFHVPLDKEHCFNQNPLVEPSCSFAPCVTPSSWEEAWLLMDFVVFKTSKSPISIKILSYKTTDESKIVLLVVC